MGDEHAQCPLYVLQTISYSMQYNPSLEASGRSGSQELLTLDESKDPFTLL
jgi:hypothetical protein